MEFWGLIEFQICCRFSAVGWRWVCYDGLGIIQGEMPIGVDKRDECYYTRRCFLYQRMQWSW